MINLAFACGTDPSVDDKSVPVEPKVSRPQIKRLVKPAETNAIPKTIEDLGISLPMVDELEVQVRKLQSMTFQDVDAVFLFKVIRSKWLGRNALVGMAQDACGGSETESEYFVVAHRPGLLVSCEMTTEAGFEVAMDWLFVPEVDGMSHFFMLTGPNKNATRKRTLDLARTIKFLESGE